MELTLEQIEGLRADLLHNARTLKHGIPIDLAEIAALCSMAARAASGVVVPESDFNELLEFLEDQEDVRDGDNGQQMPNRAMQLATTLRELNFPTKTHTNHVS